VGLCEGYLETQMGHWEKHAENLSRKKEKSGPQIKQKFEFITKLALC
jgi:hypothetical protein